MNLESGFKIQDLTPVRIRLVSWNAADARTRASELGALGYAVDADRPAGPQFLVELERRPPAAVVIDLDRAPFQGRDLALAVRTRKATARVPLVFAGGVSEKVAGVRRLLPDAVYAKWARIAQAIASAIARPLRRPVVPASRLAGYSGTPLPKKLGIKPAATVALVNAPEGLEKLLGPLPEGARLARGARVRGDLLLWFVTRRKDLLSRVASVAGRAGRDGLWICWPKQGSGLASDLTGNIVREIGLGSNLVDYKICAVDAIWSGLKFARRRR